MVDTAGQGLEGVDLRLVPFREDSFLDKVAREYRPHEAVDGRSTYDGSFEIRGSLEPPYRLVQGREGYRMAEACFLDGPSTELAVVLTRPGTVEVELQHDAAKISSWLTLEVRPQGGTEPADSVRDTFEGRTATRTGLLPGLYDVVLVGQAPGPLWTIDRVLVPEAGTTPDPRLRGIDLRRVVREITLTVLGVDGQPCADQLVVRRHPHAQERLHTDRQGRVRMEVGPRGADLEIAAPNARVWRGEGLRNDRRIRLAPPIELVVQLEGAPREVLDRTEIQVVATPTGPWNPSNPPARSVPAVGATHRVAVAEPGGFLVRWQLPMNAVPGFPRPVRASDELAREVEVPAGVDTMAVTLSIPIADLERAEQLRARARSRTERRPNESLPAWVRRVQLLDRPGSGR